MESESVNKKVSAISPSPSIFPLGYTSKSLFCQGQQNLSQTTKGREKQKAQFAITHQFDMCVKKGHPKGEESTLNMKLSLDESKWTEMINIV